MPTVPPTEQIKAARDPERTQLWADGPMMAAFIADLEPNWTIVLTDDQQRRVRAWRSGTLADARAIDRIFCALDLHAVDLELWLADRDLRIWRWHPKAAWNIPESQRHEAARLRLAGVPVTDLMRAYGVVKETIKNWSKSYDELRGRRPHKTPNPPAADGTPSGGSGRLSPSHHDTGNATDRKGGTQISGAADAH